MKFQIRQAIPSDVPAIVELLKSSLGESLTPKSEDFWNWKHRSNPFGKSPTLLSLDGDKIVGVRAFLQWQWTDGTSVLRAVRAVDTATHPQYQGKGIFKDLTMSSLADCKEQGIDFVFNTPNEKSKPGYLKMGWVEAGKLPVSFRVTRPLSLIKNLVSPPGRPAANEIETSMSHYFGHRTLKELLSKHKEIVGGQFTTACSEQFLRWRYMAVPVARYFADGVETSGILNGVFIYRFKDSRIGREMRISDVILSDPKAIPDLKQLVRQRAAKHGVDYITLSNFASANIISGGLSLRGLRIGPIVTVRHLAMTDLSPLLNFRKWNPSLGDLELF